MYLFISTPNLLIQACMAVIVLGVFYNLWVSTKAYGGIVGTAVRLLGVGLVFFSLSSLEHALVTFNIVHLTYEVSILQDVLSLLGLSFLGLGFSKLAAGAKA